MLYTTDIIINTPLTVDDIENNLLKLIHQPDSPKTDLQKFEGQLNVLNFVIYPIFDYGPRNKLRPEIKGEMLDNNISRQLNLKFRLSIIFKSIFISGLILNIAFIVALYFYSFPFWWVALIFLLVFFLMAQHSFNLKVSESIRIFKIVLNAT